MSQEQYFRLTLTLPVSIACRSRADAAVKDLVERLKDTGYDEGRYPFSREMLLHSLNMILKCCVEESVGAFFRGKFGAETVPYRSEDGTCVGEQARWVHETEAWMRDSFRWLDVRPIAAASLTEITHQEFRQLSD